MSSNGSNEEPQDDAPRDSDSENEISDDEDSLSSSVAGLDIDGEKEPTSEVLFSSEIGRNITLGPKKLPPKMRGLGGRQYFGVTKSSSTSSLFIESTLSAPNMNEVLKCMATALYLHIKAGHGSENKVFFEIFDERKHPITNRKINPDIPPRVNEIYKYLDQIFRAERLSSEVAILGLAYIERLMSLTGLTLHATNWRRVVLSALILASKVWEDQAVWNVDFISVFPNVTVNDLNTLENNLLLLINYNVSVTGQFYAKYYFELRGLAEKDRRSFPLAPLDKETAAKLETKSKEKESQAQRQGRRTMSSDNLPIRSPRHVIN